MSPAEGIIKVSHLRIGNDNIPASFCSTKHKKTQPATIPFMLLEKPSLSVDLSHILTLILLHIKVSIF